jgi:tetratricopeptide (TPR) repeat protein
VNSEPNSTIPLSPIVAGNGEENSATPSAAQAKFGLLDWLLFITVTSLAFLLASTPARNSDVWLHLAAGRSVAQGTAWGTDPFASTTGGIYWVNHTWLSDWLLYRLYEAGGGSALVIAKCVLVTAIAAMFFCFRRRGTGGGMAAFAALLSLMAAGPWLSLQPILFSLLGVIVTLWLLERPALAEEPRVKRARQLRWLVLPLFALWANLDGWFVLGPILVGLFALAEGLTAILGSNAARRRELGTLALLTLAGFAACLLTPYHYRIFSWPTPLGLTHAEQMWMHDPVGLNLVMSPFTRPFATAPAFSGPGGWAYGALLLASAISFALCAGSLRLSRLLTWLACAGLSFYQARTIPIFAVAAGPLLALNFGDWLLKIQHGERSEFRSRIPNLVRNIIRGTVLATGVALLAFAWPGLLQSTPYQRRGWSCEPDGSMARMAVRLQALHAESAFPDSGRSLNFSPDVAHYLAWSCPAEKGFVDSRWPLFSRSADDYVRMRACLLESGPSSSPQELRALADAHGIDRIVLYDPDGGRMTRAFKALLQDIDGWELLNLEGSAALFGRVRSLPPSWRPLDPRREAYHADATRLAPMAGSRAPRPAEPWESFFLRSDVSSPVFRGPDLRNPDRAEAALLMACFDEMQGRYRADSLRRWQLTQAAALPGIGPDCSIQQFASNTLMRTGCSLIPSSRAMSLTLRPQGRAPEPTPGAGESADDWSLGRLRMFFLQPDDLGPLEWLFLAVRSARRAIASNPNDAGAYMVLARAYLVLDREIGNMGWLNALPELAALRHTQILTALEQAAMLRPDLDEPHALLAQTYYREGQLDCALDHLRARAQIAEQEKERAADTKAAAERARMLESDRSNLEAVVRRSREIYDANTKAMNDPSQVLARARLAARHGLTRQALEMLLASDFAIFGREGAEMQLDLMLSAGRCFEVFDWLEPAQESVLGSQKYHMFRARAAAGCGNYAAADAEIAKLDSSLEHMDSNTPLTVSLAIVMHATNAALTFVPAFDPVSLTTIGFWSNYYLRVSPVQQMANQLRERADLHVVRGLLALEPGDADTARREFGAALTPWGNQNQSASGSSLDFFGRPIAQEMLRRMERSREAAAAK